MDNILSLHTALRIGGDCFEVISLEYNTYTIPWTGRMFTYTTPSMDRPARVCTVSGKHGLMAYMACDRAMREGSKIINLMNIISAFCKSMRQRQQRIY